MKHAEHFSIFRSAISGDDGEVDAGYLALYWVMAVVITAIPFMCLATLAEMIVDPAHRFDVRSLGIGIGSVCGGFGVAVGAVGAFRMGDKPQPGMTTTVERRVETDAYPMRGSAVTDTFRQDNSGLPPASPDAIQVMAVPVQPQPDEMKLPPAKPKGRK